MIHFNSSNYYIVLQIYSRLFEAAEAAKFTLSSGKISINVIVCRIYLFETICNIARKREI